MIPAVFRANPLEVGTETVYFEAGVTTIQQIVEEWIERNKASAAYAYDAVEAWLDGVKVPREYWHRIKPKSGKIVAVNPVLRGGGGDLLRTAALIAIAVAAPYVGAAAGGFIGAAIGGQAGVVAYGGAISAAASVAFTLGATLAINALIPPQRPKLSSLSGQQGSTTYSLTGSGNAVNKYGPVPKIYGRNRVYPVYAAETFTEVIGEDQYLTMLFCPGYGKLQLEDFRIGDTPIGQYEDVEYEILYGDETSPTLKLYPSDVSTTNESAEIRQTGGAVTRTVNNVDSAVVDLTFQGLVKIAGNGQRLEQSVAAKVEYRPSGGAWQNVRAFKVDKSSMQTLQGDNNKASKDAVYTTVPANAPVMTLTTIQPNQTRYNDWISSTPVSGNITVTLKTPQFMPNPNQPVTSLWGVRYRVWAAAEGAPLQIIQTLPWWLGAGDTYKLTIPVNKPNQRHVVRIEVIDYGKPSGDPDLQNNADGVPAPVEWTTQYTETTDGTFTFTAKDENAVRRSVRVEFPQRGAYDLRISRLTPDSTDISVSDKMYLTGIRSVKNDVPVKMQGIALIALRIRASGQLNGTIDQFNCVAEAYINAYKNGAFEQRLSRSPAWIAYDILTGNATDKPLSADDIELQDFIDFDIYCAENFRPFNVPAGVAVLGEEKHYFNAVIDYEEDQATLLSNVLKAARAAPVWRDNGKLGIFIDKAQPTVRGHITPHNSWGFKGNKSFNIIPHAIKVRYVDSQRNFIQNEVIVYKDGYNESNASLFDEIEAFGITDGARAWAYGRYHLAQMIYRQESFTVNMDAEHLAFERGDLVRVSHDVMGIGLSTGRIKSVIYDGNNHAIGASLEEPIIMGVNDSMGLRWRTANGASAYAALNQDSGEIFNVTFVNPVTSNLPAQGDLYQAGFLNQESQEFFIKEIRASQDLSAQLTLSPYNEAVYTAEETNIPQYIPVLTSNPERPTARIKKLRANDYIEITPAGQILRLKATWDNELTTPVSYYNVYLQRADGSYELQGSPRETVFNFVQTFESGEVGRVKVVPVDFKGDEGYASYFTYEIRVVVPENAGTTLVDDIADIDSVNDWDQE